MGAVRVGRDRVRGLRAAARLTGTVAAGLAGACLAVVAAGGTTAPVGPFSAQLSLRPALEGRSVLAVPPLGEVRFDTHRAPVRLEVRLREVRPEAVQQLAARPGDLAVLGAGVRRDLERAAVPLLARTALLAALGGLLGGLLVGRAARPALLGGGAAVTVAAATSALAVATASAQALRQPEFTGALAYAPAVIGDAQDVVRRIDDYTRQLGGLVTNVALLYDTARTLPVPLEAAGSVRLLHVSDLHLSPTALPLVRQVAAQFDVAAVVDTGDLTDHGSLAEDAYVEGVGTFGVPYVYVRGNHDSAATQAAVARQPGAVVLDGGEPVEVAGLVLAGHGDPRFTPDKRRGDDDAPPEVLTRVGERVRDVLRDRDVEPDVVAVHDPAAAGPLLGEVPLVLAGHAHARSVQVTAGTRLMVQGSTGGAGLRALEGEEPTPVQMTVLHLDARTGDLQAWDEITLGGLGLTDARIRRQVAAAPADAGLDAAPPATAPTLTTPAPAAR